MTEEEVVLATCSNPGCDHPGTKQCGACKITPYCGPSCQTTDWIHHKEECPGHLRKVGMAHLVKAWGFNQQRNWMQTLRHADLALTKLMLLKDRRLETVKIIDDALSLKFNALNFMGRDKDALECAKENYTLWAMNHIRNPKMFEAVFRLIQSCIHNKEFEDASLYAHTAHEMVLNDADGIVPSDKRELLLAQGCQYLARATRSLAEAGGIPPEEMQKAGERAITVARQALEIHTKLRGIESIDVAGDMGVLANVLSFFDVDDEEVFRLHEQANAIFSRVEGSTSVNVGVGEHSLGIMYEKIADRARAANDLDRCKANLELALPHYREAIRIYRAINFTDKANEVLRIATAVEENIRLIKRG